MNISETIKNIRATCNNYIDPDLLAFVIDDDYYMGTNNILEMDEYGIQKADSYEERLLKILKHKHVFLPIGMVSFIPFLNECDVFSENDYHFKLTDAEFKKYASEEEKLIGILIKKNSNEYVIGKSDTCSCSVTSSFEELEKSDFKFYKKIEEIFNEKIIS